MEEYQSVWEQCLQIIKDNIDEGNFATWFQPIKAIGLKDKVLTVQVPSLYYYEWIEGNYWQLLKSAIHRVLGKEGKVEYKILVVNEQTMTLPTSGIGVVSSQDKKLNIHIDEDTDQKEIPNPFVLPGLKKLNIQSQWKKKEKNISEEF